MPKRKTPNGTTPRPEPFKVIRIVQDSWEGIYVGTEGVLLPFPQYRDRPRDQITPYECLFHAKKKDGSLHWGTTWTHVVEWEYTGATHE